MRAETIRGVRWAAAGLVAVLAGVAVYRIATAPSGEGEPGSGAELEITSPAAVEAVQAPVVPPPPPSQNDVPPPPTRATARRASGTRPSKQAAAPAPYVIHPVVVPPLELAETPGAVEPVEAASASPSEAEPGTPGNPIIIRPPERKRDAGAVRVLKSVGRVFGIGRKQKGEPPAEPPPEQ